MAHELSGTIKVEYNTSPLHRVVHVDGTWGGVNTLNSLFISFYSDRPPAPKHALIPVRGGVQTGPEDITLDAMKREIEVTVQLETQTAISFLAWLTDKVEEMADATGMPRSELARAIAARRAGS